MKTGFAICCATLLLAASACEREIDFPIEPEGSRIFLECFPSDGSDTTFVRLAAAIPVTEPDASQELSDISLDFRINDKSFVPKPYSEDDQVYTYFVETVLKTGDVVSVRAEAGGCPSVESVTSIPAHADMEMSREIYNYGTLRHRFTVRRDDASGDKRYYGIAILGERRLETTYTDPEKEPETEISPMQFEYEAESSIESRDDQLLGSAAIAQCKVNGRNMLVFEDDGGKTAEIEITVDIPYDEDKYWATTPDYRVFRRTLYKVELYSLSRQAYEYLNPQTNEALIGSGLIPPFISSGNVSGGYGICSGMGCASTGWIGAPEDSGVALAR